LHNLNLKKGWFGFPTSQKYRPDAKPFILKKTRNIHSGSIHHYGK